ncbi:MAG: hypothetical protein IE880_03460, partial [Epsilonproteobacteria bacterium]|nr:hypothetical protein [Campylobacterota bacterium]
MLDVDKDHRIHLINNFDYGNYSALVQTYITTNDELIIYTQHEVQKENKSSFKKEDFYSLVKALKYFEQIGYVHGDLNKKNILWTNDGFKIIDYEPSILQLVNDQKQLRVTIPYVINDEL